MRVQIDQAGGDDITRYIAHLGPALGLQCVSDYGHLAVGEADIRDGVEFLRGIDNASAAQDQIKGHHVLPMKG